MKIEFPRLDYLEHLDNNKLTIEQQEWFALISHFYHIINLSTYNFTDPITKNQQSVQFSKFLKELNSISLVDEQSRCLNKMLFDNFVFIADMSARPLKAIVENPSSKIEKLEEKVPVNRLKSTSPKTMQWLSRRPGRNVREKIAPENKVLTQMTHFTLRTKENEMTMYLYDQIEDIVSPRYRGSGCENCPNKNLSCKRLADKMRTVLSLRDSINRSELKDVSKIKHTVKNNKLMCDKYYKVIWDATDKLLSEEEEIKSVWNHVIDNYIQLFFWTISARLAAFENIEVIDAVGRIAYDNGRVMFDTQDQDYCNNAVNFITYYDENIISEIKLKKEGAVISLNQHYKNIGNSAVDVPAGKRQKWDFSNIEKEIDKYIVDNEMKQKKDYILRLCNSLNIRCASMKKEAKTD